MASGIRCKGTGAVPVTQFTVTAIWDYAIPPTVPLYWRAASATPAEDFLSVASSTISTRIAVIEVSGRPRRRHVPYLLAVLDRARQQVLQLVRPADVPAALAVGWQLCTVRGGGPVPARRAVPAPSRDQRSRLAGFGVIRQALRHF